ncbi:MAG TPA: hypothetical protein VHV10_20625 [Ktedonobacteraceae bacterium]|jgi:hypothetical protein|nr:hypothetical protein [Ktedonobacteraceae bacterium]
MTAKNITNLRPPEQDFEQNTPVEPWMRQKNEPADWFMRFRRYLEMGTKRGLRALVAAEAGTQVNTKEGKKLSDVSVPRAWRRASKLWRWTERAAAYDLAQTEKQAAQIRTYISSIPYTSKAYRIVKLDYLARMLKLQLKPDMELKWCLAVTARYQSVMRDLAREMESLDDATLTECEASAMLTIKQEWIEQEYADKLKSAATHERNKLVLDRADKLAKLEKQQR